MVIILRLADLLAISWTVKHTAERRLVGIRLRVGAHRRRRVFYSNFSVLRFRVKIFSPRRRVRWIKGENY